MRDNGRGRMDCKEMDGYKYGQDNPTDLVTKALEEDAIRWTIYIVYALGLLMP